MGDSNGSRGLASSRLRRRNPAPVLAQMEPDGDSKPVVPVRRIGHRDGRGRDQVGILGVLSGTARPIVGALESDRAVYNQLFGVRYPCPTSIHTGTPTAGERLEPLRCLVFAARPTSKTGGWQSAGRGLPALVCSAWSSVPLVCDVRGRECRAWH